MSFCGHISSCQAINAAATRDPSVDRAYLLLEATERGESMPEPVPCRGGRQNE
jgi:hypothetical protein